jgi:hypothetical protein
MRIFENSVLWTILVRWRQEVTWGWTKLPNEELHNLCFSPNIIRVMRYEWVM